MVTSAHYYQTFGRERWDNEDLDTLIVIPGTNIIRKWSIYMTTVKSWTVNFGRIEQVFLFTIYQNPKTYSLYQVKKKKVRLFIVHSFYL